MGVVLHGLVPLKKPGLIAGLSQGNGPCGPFQRFPSTQCTLNQRRFSGLFPAVKLSLALVWFCTPAPICRASDTGSICPHCVSSAGLIC